MTSVLYFIITLYAFCYLKRYERNTMLYVVAYVLLYKKCFSSISEYSDQLQLCYVQPLMNLKGVSLGFQSGGIDNVLNPYIGVSHPQNFSPHKCNTFITTVHHFMLLARQVPQF